MRVSFLQSGGTRRPLLSLSSTRHPRLISARNTSTSSPASPARPHQPRARQQLQKPVDRSPRAQLFPRDRRTYTTSTAAMSSAGPTQPQSTAPAPTTNPISPTTTTIPPTTTTTTGTGTTTETEPSPEEPLTESHLLSLLHSRLSQPPSPPPLHVEVHDQSGGCGQAFAALVVSDVFAGKGTLARHRLVNGLLREEVKRVHAWEVRCLTGGEWEKIKAKEMGG